MNNAIILKNFPLIHIPISYLPLISKILKSYPIYCHSYKLFLLTTIKLGINNSFLILSLWLIDHKKTKTKNKLYEKENFSVIKL
ncbi:hypothetical protein XSR1_540016 [Xenorhabdus szentirmaii DSM 16338]|uniref:Uncharacterized protein n=1 Tax=Xenorhabdus szentirmaii DSM 16338 TaxID=1427518 RepID=W1J5U9_9GAMM|nr:hypothetical protein XSR1_540016 [Xenorhabdus szentirmaii DSM 16338]